MSNILAIFEPVVSPLVVVKEAPIPKLNLPNVPCPIAHHQFCLKEKSV